MNYQLQPYNGPRSRYRCPQCNHSSNSFVRYVNVLSGAELAQHVGRCNRTDKCGYHFNPRKYYQDAGYTPLTILQVAYNGKFKNPYEATHKRREIQGDSYIHGKVVDDSFTAYQQNNFVQYLVKRIGFDKANQLVGRYRIGTSKHWPGATVFWQLDRYGYARTGKIMRYNAETGKRVKEPFNHITWAHSILAHASKGSKKEDAYWWAHGHEHFKLNQCLFGEHLLAAEPHKVVGVVESEKTAIIASAHMPEFVWVACGSLNGLNPIKCRVLSGRQVVLFPDVNALAEWQKAAHVLQIAMPGTTIVVSQTLEQLATEEHRSEGVDVADVLV